MAVKAIAYSYWRRIKADARTFDRVPENVQEDVRTLAKQDVVDKVITEDEYKKLIGEEYSANTAKE